MQHVRVDRTLPGAPAEVFRWFVEPQLLTQWWPSEADIDPQVGGRFRMYWAGPDVTLRGEYRHVAPGAELVFTWAWDHEDLPPRTVSMAFTPTPDGDTNLAVTHEAESDEEATGYRDGWDHFLGALANQLA